MDVGCEVISMDCVLLEDITTYNMLQVKIVRNKNRSSPPLRHNVFTCEWFTAT